MPMADHCSVRGCSTVILSGKENTHKLYRFPRDKKLNTKWKDVLRLHEITSNDRVCSLHFLDTDYIQTNLGWRVLIPGAVPSLSIDLPQEISNGLHTSQSMSNTGDVFPVSVKQEIEDTSDNLTPVQQQSENIENPVDIALIKFDEENISEDVSDTDTLPPDFKVAESELTLDENFGSIETDNNKSPPPKKKKLSAGVICLNEDVINMGVTCETVMRSPEKFPCSLCGKEFSDRLVLLMHMTFHFKAGKSICSKCGLMFSTSEECKKHSSKSCYPKLNSPKSSLGTNCAKPETPLDNFFCTLCGKTFNLWSKLCDHYKKHLTDNLITDTCVKCNYTARNTEELERHVSDVHIQNKFSCCHKCKRVFRSKSAKFLHTKDLGHGLHLECPECCKRFASMSYLIAHLKTHICITFYSCEFCQLIFTSIDCIETHVFNHIAAGDRNINCNFCLDGNPSYHTRNSQYHSHRYIYDSSNEISNDVKAPHNGTVAPVSSTASSSTLAASSAPSSAAPSVASSAAPSACLSAASSAAPSACLSATSSDVSIAAPLATSSATSKLIETDVKLKCDDCDENFRNESELSSHLKMHESRGDFCCIECGVQCESIKALTSHYEEHIKSDQNGEGSWSSSEEDL